MIIYFARLVGQDMKNINIKFVKQDAWIGLFWKTIDLPAVCHCGDLIGKHDYWHSNHSPVPIEPLEIETTWYLCLIPCFPIIWKTYGYK